LIDYGKLKLGHAEHIQLFKSYYWVEGVGHEVFMDNWSKSNSSEASLYEEETGYCEERRWTDLDRETIHEDNVSYRSIWICWKRVFQRICIEYFFEASAEETCLMLTSKQLPGWENISAEVLVFQYTECIIRR
jgi:hypothetical protein